jgi:hypothetical protein
VAQCVAVKKRRKKIMSDESKARIVLVLVCSFFSFLGGVYCQQRFYRSEENQATAHYRAAAAYYQAVANGCVQNQSTTKP